METVRVILGLIIAFSLIYLCCLVEVILKEMRKK